MSVIIDQNLDFKKEFLALKDSTSRLSKTSASERVKKLDAILFYLSNSKNIADFENAIFEDFRKSSTEFKITELTPVLSHIKFIKRNIRSWMRNKKVRTPLVLTGTSSHIKYQAKGVVLVISTWNYPFNISLIPLLYAIAAGNAIILKPSEIAPKTSSCLKKMINEIFPTDEIKVIEGAAETAISLLKLPFNHIFFTGSPMIGAKVMEAAAKNLCSVTLELGGKSPVIFDEEINIKSATEKLVWGKLINDGQTCLAPDYLLVKESQKDQTISCLKEAIIKQFGHEPNECIKSPDLTRIVSNRHFLRIKNILEDAVLKGAKIEFGGHMIEEENFIAPTLVSNVSDDMLIMKEEIFGPLLPMIVYETKEDVLKEIEKNPRPLVLYILSKKKKNIDYYIDNTSAGGTVVNDFLIHYGNPDLAFGGINQSGIGKSNGKHGFIEFSNERGIMQQKFGTLKMIYPPYTDAKKKLINFLKKLV